MICPRCEIASLEERLRGGVTIHVCCGCRGVWFSRGELGNLVTRLSSEWEASQRTRTSGDLERLDEAKQSRPGNRSRPSVTSCTGE